MVGTLIGAGLGVASSIIGGAMSAKANREAQKIGKAKDAADLAWYNRNYNTSSLDSESGQAGLTTMKERANEIYKRADGASAVGGGTPESVYIAKERGDKMVGDYVRDVVANDTEYRKNVDNVYNQMRQNSANRDIAYQQNLADNIASATGSAASSLGAAGSAYDDLALEEKRLGKIGSSTGSNSSNGG